MSDPRIGTIVDGRYRIDHVVGAGGFGVVYRAQHLHLGAPVALKVLKLASHVSAGERAELIGTFFDEARTLKRLRHPHVIAALDVGMLEDGETPYLVMEWCAGPTLKEHIAKRGAMPVAEAWTLFAPIVDALAHAHRENIAHRDLKPANILLDERGTPRVIDFGIAKLCNPDEGAGSGDTHTRGESRFTPRYAAPEQLAGARTGPWTDVHALGLLFVELVLGKPAIQDGDARLASIDPIRPTPARHGTDVGALEPVLARALALRPAERHADAGVLARAMRDAIAPRTRWHLILAPIAVVALLGIVGGALALLRARRSTAAADPPIAPVAVAEPAFSSASSAAPAIPRLRDEPALEIQRRAQKLPVGLCELSVVPSGYFITCDRMSLVAQLNVLPGMTTSDAMFAHASQNALGTAKSMKRSARVAVDKDFSLVMTCETSADADGMFDTIVGSDAVDRRGPPDDQAFEMRPEARKALAAWNGTDLIARLREMKKDVTYSNAFVTPSVVNIGMGDMGATIHLYVGDPRRSLGLRHAVAPGPLAYAIDGDRLLVVASSSNKSYVSVTFLTELLGGAHADEARLLQPKK